MGPVKVLGRLVHKIADMTMFKIVGNDYTYIYNVSWVSASGKIRRESHFSSYRRILVSTILCSSAPRTIT